MKRIFTRSFFFAFLFFPVLFFSQGEFNNWYFGVKDGVSFNSGNQVPCLTSQLVQPSGGSVNISDHWEYFVLWRGGWYDRKQRR
jgi:hypothetical protein